MLSGASDVANARVSSFPGKSGLILIQCSSAATVHVLRTAAGMEGTSRLVMNTVLDHFPLRLEVLSPHAFGRPPAVGQHQVLAHQFVPARRRIRVPRAEYPDPTCCMSRSVRAPKVAPHLAEPMPLAKFVRGLNSSVVPDIALLVRRASLWARSVQTSRRRVHSHQRVTTRTTRLLELFGQCCQTSRSRVRRLGLLELGLVGHRDLGSDIRFQHRGSCIDPRQRRST